MARRQLSKNYDFLENVKYLKVFNHHRLFDLYILYMRRYKKKPVEIAQMQKKCKNIFKNSNKSLQTL